MPFCKFILGQYWGVFVRAVNTLDQSVTIRVDKQGNGDASHVA